jgi:hypothetical protein
MEIAKFQNTNENKENFLNKKVKRDSHSDKTANDSHNTFKKSKQLAKKSTKGEKGDFKQPAQGITKFTQIESLYNRARQLYEANVIIILIY